MSRSDWEAERAWWLALGFWLGVATSVLLLWLGSAGPA
jgi:hypothetical protein